jgi:hypothetical protein
MVFPADFLSSSAYFDAFSTEQNPDLVNRSNLLLLFDLTMICSKYEG